ncbi:MAG: fibronectin type III-like domain-contianing protein, partial [Pseudomonadota bacterium]|nr:fibronectin type III-like domain-contianing protein [Pseudomonadota bacterium]
TLQNFKKIKIKKGQIKTVKLKLDKRNFSYWDVTSKSWRLKEKEYEILIGSSSENIHLRKKVYF